MTKTVKINTTGYVKSWQQGGYNGARFDISCSLSNEKLPPKFREAIQCAKVIHLEITYEYDDEEREALLENKILSLKNDIARLVREREATNQILCDTRMYKNNILSEKRQLEDKLERMKNAVQILKEEC